MSALRQHHGKRVTKAPQQYYKILPPKEWADIVAHWQWPPTDPKDVTLIEDYNSINKQKIDSTTKKALIDARIGQGKFRVEVLQCWGNACSVTGSVTLTAIRASHIKPWRESPNKERLDRNNGLPLLANLDALFDAGLISFASSGALLISPKLNQKEGQILGLGGKSQSLRKKPTRKTGMYLAYHRHKYGFKE